jgi:hypothetical protein
MKKFKDPVFILIFSLCLILSLSIMLLFTTGGRKHKSVRQSKKIEQKYDSLVQKYHDLEIQYIDCQNKKQ